MKQQLLSLLVAVGLLYAAPLAFAWSRPVQTPPAGNTTAPINVGTSPQIKDGWIGLFGAAAGLTVSKEITYQKPTSLLVGVKGSVGADRYCNAAGTSCGTIDELLGGPSYSYSTTTVNQGCGYRNATFTRTINISAGNNQSSSIILLDTIAGGTYTVSGSGKSVKCGSSSCGNHGASIIVSKDGSFSAGALKLYSLAAKAGKNWTVDRQTFTTENEEKIRASVTQGSMTGTLTITGPRLFCTAS